MHGESRWSLNMQQAVLGCSQLEKSIPALGSCFPSCCTPDPHRAGPKSKHILTSRGEEGGKAQSRLSQQIPPSPSTSPSPCHSTSGAGLDISQSNSGQKIQLPASLARDEKTTDTLLAMAVRGHIKQVPLPRAVDFAWRSSNASPTLQLKCQTSDLLHSRVLSLFSSPSLFQHGRAVKIQFPFPGE